MAEKTLEINPRQIMKRTMQRRAFAQQIIAYIVDNPGKELQIAFPTTEDAAAVFNLVSAMLTGRL